MPEFDPAQSAKNLFDAYKNYANTDRSDVLHKKGWEIRDKYAPPGAVWVENIEWFPEKQNETDIMNETKNRYPGLKVDFVEEAAVTNSGELLIAAGGNRKAAGVYISLPRARGR